MREHKKSHLGIMGWAMFLAGAMSLGSCSSDETLESMEPKAITFGSVSMENHSRAAYDPSYSANDIASFQVWGTVTGNKGSALIFDGAKVENKNPEDLTQAAGYNNVWYCPVTQYWIPGASYEFLAIVDGNKEGVTSITAEDELGMPTTISYTADGETDLLCQKVSRPQNSNENVVAFEFTHLLSKVHFTFQDGSGKPVANTTITDIQVTGHNASGTYTIGATNPWGTPTPAAEGESLKFGAATAYVNATTPVTSANARLVIPGKQTWSISFSLNGSKQTLELKDQTFEANQAYNLIVTLGKSLTLQVIKVAEWVPVNVVNQYNNSVVASQMVTWDESTFNKDYFATDHVIQLYDDKAATFGFELISPMGGTWHAMFLTEQGPSDAFVFVDEKGKELGVSCEGMVGKPYKLGVKAKGANESGGSYLAKLHFVVDMGEYIEAHVLTNNIDYKVKQVNTK